MKKVLSLVALPALLLVSLPGSAQGLIQPNTLGTCMTDSMTGKERKVLAEWIFLGMASHPQMAGYATVADEARVKTDKVIGAMVTRLLTEDCPGQAKQALKEQGALAFQAAFGLVGQVAMQELMADRSVNESMASFERYMDKKKMASLAAE